MSCSCFCDVLLQAYARAVRNCPWVGSLWSAALRAHERLGGAEQQHEDMANRALAAGLQVIDEEGVVFAVELGNKHRTQHAVCRGL